MHRTKMLFGISGVNLTDHYTNNGYQKRKSMKKLQLQIGYARLYFQTRSIFTILMKSGELISWAVEEPRKLLMGL